MKLFELTLARFELTVFPENCYVIGVKGRSDCVVIDPGIEPAQPIDSIKQNGLTPSALLITHGHVDHIRGIAEFETEWPQTPIYIGENDKTKLSDPEGNLSSSFGIPFATHEPPHSVHDGEIIESAGLVFKTLEAPGHSSGHVVYVLECEERSVVFCGDVIFAGSIGRTDFPDGNQMDLIRNIREKLLTLPDNTLLCPGHGPSTTVVEEKLNNPYLRLL